MSFFNPWAGYSLGQDIPDYFNPYKAYSAAGVSQQQAQQQAQRNVPGKDAPTPGSKHGPLSAGKPGMVRLASPRGTVKEVPQDQVNFWIAKGARRI